MKLFEITDTINVELSKFIGSRVDLANTFHEDVRDCVNDVLSYLNLTNTFEYRPWKMQLTNDTVSLYCIDVCELKLELKEDKRYKYNRVGTVTNLYFKILDECTSNLTIDELIQIKMVESKECQISQCEYAISLLRDELESKIKSLTQLNTELEEIKKLINI